MSQLPRFGGGKPLIKTTTTTTSKVPGSDATRTTTRTRMTELLPCTSADPSIQNASQFGTAGCKVCPSQPAAASQGQIARPPSGLRPPGGASGLRLPGSRVQLPSQAGQSRLNPQQAPLAVRSGSSPPSGISRLAPPSGRPTGGLRPPSGLALPQAGAGAPPSGGIRPPSGLALPQAGVSRLAPPTGGIRPPSGILAGGIRPPGGMAPPQASGIRRLPSVRVTAPTPAVSAPPPRRSPSPQRLPAPMPGEYMLPAEYGPQTVKGKGMVYSSPSALRGQLEAKMPKDLKYFSTKPCPGGRDRSALQGTQLQDTFSGGFNVYGQPTTTQEMVYDRGVLDRRMDETTAQELFDMINADVSMVDEQVAQDLLNKSLHDSEIRVFAKGQDIQQVQQRMVHTPAGLQPVLQQTYTEKRVERDEMAEKVVKNLSVIEIDETTGLGTRVTISEQQLDPGYGLSNEGRDVVTVKETISITPSYTSTAKDIIHEVTKPLIDIDPAELAQLVEEESQDVENTLQMAPPDLTLSPEKYGIKKRLQKLRLNSESMVLLEESVVNPTPTADEALVETPPEALASIMHTVESGVTPQCAPDQVFNTLFEEKGDEQCITLSSIGPGPLQDVMVPQELPIELHKEAMTSDLTKLTDIIRNVSDPEEIPHVDIFSAVMEADQKTTKRGIKSRPFKPIHEEDLPWSDQDLEPLVNIVGAEPAVVLDPANIPDLETSGTLEQELTHGIEYFVEADPVQYMSRVQLRGTYAPPWFPGYIYALPEFQEVVKIARCPDEVFASSWKSCQPRIIPDESISILP